jgi:hypothetical protein
MGGNALKEYGVVRVDSATEAKTANDVIAILSAFMREAGLDLKPVKVESYRQKSDHGDIDILVPDTLRHLLNPEQIADLFRAHYGVDVPCVYRGSEDPDPQMHLKTALISLGVPLENGELVQVDLIWIKPEEIEFAKSYYSWNDLGNLIGVTARKLGLKFGHNGLFLPINKGDRYAGTSRVSLDFAESIAFLGYSYARWAKGFNTLEDIFSFVMSSKYFMPESYLLDNRNHQARMRDKKRPTYTKFLNFLREHNIQGNGHLLQAQLDYEAAMAELEKLIARKFRLNGQLIAGITGLRNNELGLFIEAFKSQYGDNFDAEVLDKGEDFLIAEIKRFYTSRQNNETDGPSFS